MERFQGISQQIVKLEWLVLMCLYPFQWLFIVLEVGKQSLFGDHSMHGTEGIHFFTKLKTVTSRWPKSIQSGPEFVIPTN